MVTPDELATVPLFYSLSDPDLDALTHLFQPRDVSEGIELTGEGASGYSFFILLDGSAVVTANGEALAELGPGEFFGETAILCDAPRNATIKASESLLTLRISKDMFYRLVTEFPTMAVEMMRELAHRVEDTNQKLREATANKAA